jgi:hypothetical protein
MYIKKWTFPSVGLTDDVMHNIMADIDRKGEFIYCVTMLNIDRTAIDYYGKARHMTTFVWGSYSENVYP